MIPVAALKARITGSVSSRLQTLLSREETRKILTPVCLFYHYAYLMTLYSRGLWLQEGLYVKS